MAKVTVTLTAQYDDGKSIKNPGDTISLDEKLAARLATLGMVTLAVEAAAPTTKKSGKKADQQQGGNLDPDNLDPDNLDPDKMGSDDPDADADGDDDPNSDGEE